MSRTNGKHDERNGNTALEHKEEEVQDPQRRPPHHRETTPSRRRNIEAPVESPAREENPPQTIGPRERSNDAV